MRQAETASFRKHMAGGACHVACCTTRFGLTQVSGVGKKTRAHLIVRWKGLVEIRRDEDSDHPSFTFSGVVDIGHGKFTASNSALTFLNLGEFAEALDKFILRRDSQPCLEGTYDSYLRVWQSGNGVMLGFCIGDAFCGWVGTSEFKLQGGFPVEQEMLNSLASAFRSLAGDA